MFAGGVVMEIISYQFLPNGSTPFAYVCEASLEEFLEMAGASIILYGSSLLLVQEPSEERKEIYLHQHYRLSNRYAISNRIQNARTGNGIRLA